MTTNLGTSPDFTADTDRQNSIAAVCEAFGVPRQGLAAVRALGGRTLDAQEAG